MANLRDFRVDTHAISDGIWIRVNEAAYDDLEILSRGFTDDFIDASNARQAKAAERFGGDRTRIPNAEMREINADLLRRYLVVDVRNLKDENGNDVDIQTFHAMLGDPAYARLSRACWDAAGRVSTQSATQLEGAVKNSPRPLAHRGNGETYVPG